MKKLFFILVLFLPFAAGYSNGRETKTEQNSDHSLKNDSTLAASGVPEVAHPDSFALGADVGWLTEMEAANYQFFDSTGTQMECMSLLKSLGINAIRLRAWVNPPDGWCNTEDLLVKALRAKKLGMRLMIDFHYSDGWADPGKQNKPEAWKGMSLDEMTRALFDYTKNVLETLKEHDITPEWVQIGNETTYGMLWDNNDSVSGALTASNGANYTKLNNAGYDAAKAVFPDTKVVLHIDRGQLQELSEQLFDAIIPNEGKLDVLGLSLYPQPENWQQYSEDCLKNMQWIVNHYGKEVMICETGMSWDKAETAKKFLQDLIRKTRSVTDSAGHHMGLGVFYWEPECYNWKGYSMGAFNENGTPTEAMNAFKEK